MEEEMRIMKEKEVFRLVPCPDGANIIGLHWVYDNKLDANRNLLRRKACLVAKGYTQIPGVDFDERMTDTSVVHLESMCMVVVVAAELGLKIWQVDFITAYLNSKNKYTVYMEQAPGFVKQGEEDKVYVADKTVYGMMNGTNAWAEELSRSYNRLSYYQSRADSCVWSQRIGNELTITSTYTDDVFGASSTDTGAALAKEELSKCYEVKDLGELHFILGICIDCNATTGAISLSQHAYLERVLEHFKMSKCNAKSTPLPVGLSLTEADFQRG